MLRKGPWPAQGANRARDVSARRSRSRKNSPGGFLGPRSVPKPRLFTAKRESRMANAPGHAQPLGEQTGAVCYQPRSITLPQDTKTRESGQAIWFRGLSRGLDKPGWWRRASLSGLPRGIANCQWRFTIGRQTDQRRLLDVRRGSRSPRIGCAPLLVSRISTQRIATPHDGWEHTRA